MQEGKETGQRKRAARKKKWGEKGGKWEKGAEPAGKNAGNSKHGKYKRGEKVSKRK